MTPPEAEQAAAWIADRQRPWRDLAASLDELDSRTRTDAKTVFAAVRSYPETARDLATARRVAPNSALVRQLGQAYARLHRSLFRPPSNLRHDLARLLVHDAPAVAHELRYRIFGVAVGFLLAAGAGWWLVTSHPGLVYLFASEQMIEAVENGELWTDGLLNVMPSSVLAVSILTNNIAVALTAVCLGCVYGLGTVYIVALNGIMIGGAFAFAAQHQLAMRLLEFIVAHGFVELSIIFIASAIGFSIGEALARPAHRTRRQAFQRAAMRGTVLLAPCVLFLVAAGVIEGYVSPNPAIPVVAKLAIGLGAWLILLLALGMFRWRGRVTPGAEP